MFVIRDDYDSILIFWETQELYWKKVALCFVNEKKKGKSMKQIS